MNKSIFPEWLSWYLFSAMLFLVIVVAWQAEHITALEQEAKTLREAWVLTPAPEFPGCTFIKVTAHGYACVDSDGKKNVECGGAGCAVFNNNPVLQTPMPSGKVQP